MRVSAGFLLVVLGLLTGCSVGPNAKLRVLVKEAAFADSSSSDCEWGSSSFENEPKSWYGCWDYVPGALEQVSRTLRSGLAAQRFELSSRKDVRSVQLTAVRGADTLCVDVLAQGFVRGRNTAPSEIDIPVGEVFVDIWTTEPGESARVSGRPRCAPLPPFPE